MREKMARVALKHVKLILVVIIAIAALVAVVIYAVSHKHPNAIDSKPNTTNNIDAGQNIDTNHQTSPDTKQEDNQDSKEKTMNITVNGKTLTAIMEDNSSAEALLELLNSGELTLNMHDYGGMEKVGALDTTLPTNDRQITTQPGDIILYQGNQITIYYNTNNWSLTKLGHINNMSAAELRELLGEGDIVATFSK